MLEKYGATCDDCGGYHHFNTNVFSERIQEIKDEGWKIIKSYGIWKHYCEDCKPIDGSKIKRELWYNDN